jgi:hypothetical protein
MPPRLWTRIEYIKATEDRYMLLDANNEEGRARSMDHLERDTPEWFAWLSTLPSFHFAGKQGSYTARKDQKKRGAGYWYAYRRHRNKLLISYLGTTDQLTLAHLEEGAAVLEQKALHNSQDHELCNADLSSGSQEHYD